MPLMPFWKTKFQLVPHSPLGLILPVIGGIIYACVFPPLRIWPLVFIAWIPLWTVLASDAASPQNNIGWRRPFFQGWLMGATGFVLILHWLLAISNEEVNIPGIMIPGLLLLGLYIGLFYGLAALASSKLSRATGWPIALIAPLITLGFEYLRSLGPLGFPWAAPGYGLAKATMLIQGAACYGFWGLCLFILLVNAMLLMFLRGRRCGGLVAAVLLIATAVSGQVELNRHEAGTIPADRDSLQVMVAQPDIRREIKWKREKKAEVVDLVFAHADSSLAARAAASGHEIAPVPLDLFIWPETVLPLRLLSDKSAYARVRSLANRINSSILIGTQEGYWVGEGPDPQWHAHNSALLIHSDGSRSPLYRKSRLVPFSERMPLQEILPWLTDIDFGQSNFFPGEKLELLRTDKANIGCLICFESAFPELAGRYVREGADLLVLITNDFWFGSSAGPKQHAEMSILRAVENRISLVRCANTGVSFFVDPWGRVSHEIGLFVKGDIYAPIALGGGSFASSHPDWIVTIVVAAILLILIRAVYRTVRRCGKESEHV
jgi:apolipoprotein N-acyltransferase